jgi:hypothetical protein
LNPARKPSSGSHRNHSSTDHEHKQNIRKEIKTKQNKPQVHRVFTCQTRLSGRNSAGTAVNDQFAVLQQGDFSARIDFQLF